MVVFGVLAALGVIWTAVWVWVLGHSGGRAAYEELVPKVDAIRRRLFYLSAGSLTLLLLVSFYWLPYFPVRALTIGKPQLVVQVIASQWYWKLSTSEVPAKTPIEFVVTSKDVNHGLAVYSPDGKLLTQVQAMPGYTNHLIYAFERPGTYMIRCLEYCGMPHYVMVTPLTVK